MSIFSSTCLTDPRFICHGFLLPILLLLLQISSQLGDCGTIVKYLPGFQGPLPFLLETGYIGVGENDDVQSFYYFIESENNPREDPLMLWLTGGPGCSAFSGLVYEIGPLAFQVDEYDGGLPSLVYKPNSWTKVSSIVFVDLPVNTGFSYARTEFASQRSDSLSVNQAYQFLRKWIMDHPEFLNNKVYIAGDSYSGMHVPIIADEISKANERGLQPWINLQGYLMGNPIIDRNQKNYVISFAHGMGLISDELYKSLQKHCKGEYVNVDMRNVLCSRDLNSFDEITSGIATANILEPKCEFATQKPLESSWRRSLTDNYHGKFKDTHLRLPSRNCRSYGYLLSAYWANDDKVRNALNVRKGTKKKWKRCTRNMPYKYDISSNFPYQVNLSRKGYRSLIYSGDHDMVVPFLATQAWIRSLNYSIVDDWRPWYTNGQVAGYTRTYSNAMTFATVKGGGHTAPEYKPEECLNMYSRWMSRMAL
ncbi:serine carboxypeptidase-like 2 isoform X1 [Arachis duranensis]|uniref:Serine carboxypeptidase-like 2 isoform X1 n=1 Tax=Arachis duranensis TaxID=130453 RepID=A0A9C6TCQ2_ARADU|nr:serine carboxypeptidase-like 2 isoform X1 [Arachis duranensis]XP_052111757.1 serine carboxypeptidase-like 2 isoform X1 [Arachis duranensis]